MEARRRFRQVGRAPRHARPECTGLTNRANKGSVPANYPPEPYSGATEGGRS